MAIATNNGPKPNAGEIRQVLNFLKEILPNRYVKAIAILLHPCCLITGTATAECDGNPSTFDVTVITDTAILFPGVTSIIATIDGIASVGTLVNPTTITFTYNAPADILTPTPLDITVQITDSTSFDGTIGVSQTFTISDVSFDGTPCD